MANNVRDEEWMEDKRCVQSEICRPKISAAYTFHFSSAKSLRDFDASQRVLLSSVPQHHQVLSSVSSKEDVGPIVLEADCTEYVFLEHTIVQTYHLNDSGFIAGDGCVVHTKSTTQSGKVSE